MLTKNSGQSILEIIIAVSILVIVASSAVIAMLGSFTTTTLGQQQTKATWLASQGLAAAESLANQDYSYLINGTYGLENNNGTWQLVSEPDVSEALYTREITISDGPIANSRQIIAQVSWPTSLVKTNKVSLETVITNWQVGKRSLPDITVSPVPEIIDSCLAYCQSIDSYTTGTCRQNSNRCPQYSETYESGGDLYCSGGLSSCCCGN